MRKQLKQALQQIVDLTGRFEKLQQEIEKLQQENEKLRLQLEKLQKAGKRQAAPFRKQEEPAKPPRKPGRKRGRRHGRHAHRSVPPRIDETYDVPLPKACPHCGGKHISETEISPQYQTEIPRTVIYRRFDVHVGDCKTCHRKVRPPCLADIDGSRRGGEPTGSERARLAGDSQQAARPIARQERQAAANHV